ncbi:MAG: right-handed parallel beta-helix repeat-containing protein [Tannerella sp.]|jgi:hypothetical protein|nr:right-handed parallel beta-helix repeat-containing protein [Tannerella sp.]
MKTRLFLMILAFVSVFGAQGQVNLYVNAAKGDDANSGTLWSRSLKTLQAALDKAPENVHTYIHVAEGVYVPTKKIGVTKSGAPVSERQRAFAIPEGVTLWGGYPVSADDNTQATTRDPKRYPTILSGDLDGDDAPDFANRADNAYHVVVFPDITSIEMDGFTVEGGYADGDTTEAVTYNGTPLLNDRGGGIYAFTSIKILFVSFTLQNLTVRDNLSLYQGGGIYVYSTSGNASPQISYSLITGNKSEFGGGLYANGKDEASPVLINTVFSGNVATYKGGGAYCLTESNNSSPILYNVLFSGNKAFDAGAMVCYSYTGDVKPRLVNVTISGNKAEDECGGFGCFAVTGVSHPTILNSVITGNKASSADNFYNRGVGGTGATVRTSLIGGIALTEGNNLPSDADPLFVSPVDADFAPSTDGDYSLTAESPLINRGNNHYTLYYYSDEVLNESLTPLPQPLDDFTDLAGNPRFVGSAVDIGAYEYQSIIDATEQIADSRIWGRGGAVHIAVSQPSIVRVYTLDGKLARLSHSSEGEAVIPMPEGVYLVTVNNGRAAKVYVSNR